MAQHRNQHTDVNSFAQLFAGSRKQIEYWVEGAILEYTEEIVRHMTEQNLTRRSLAEKLGASPAYVTKLLGGQNNFTLRKMVEVARAVNCGVRVHLEKDGVKTSWREYRTLKKASARQTLAAPNPNLSETDDWRPAGTTRTLTLNHRNDEPVELKNDELPAAA